MRAVRLNKDSQASHTTPTIPYHTNPIKEVLVIPLKTLVCAGRQCAG